MHYYSLHSACFSNTPVPSLNQAAVFCIVMPALLFTCAMHTQACLPTPTRDQASDTLSEDVARRQYQIRLEHEESGKSMGGASDLKGEREDKCVQGNRCFFFLTERGTYLSSAEHY